MSARGGEIVLEHVRKTFEDGRIVALDDVSLAVESGEFVALTGPSGCGKSTLLNLVGALDRADAGTIVVGGERVDQLEDPPAYRAEVVGFVFQFHNLIPTLSALENVQVPLLGRGIPRAERVARAEELLRETAVAHRASSYPPTMSGGERQRVAIARALANRPRVLLADEPTGALDVAVGQQILSLLESVRERRETTILLVTNDLVAAERADRTLQMRDGKIQPSDRATESFVP